MRSPYQAYKSPFGPQYVDFFLFGSETSTGIGDGRRWKVG